MVPVAAGRHISETVTQRGETRRVLHLLIEALGPPSQYGGDAAGPSIRWQADTHTVILDARSDGRLQLSVRRTIELERTESARFLRYATQGASGDEGSRGLPYLWRYRPRDSAQPPVATLVARDWAQLQATLTALLGAWSENLEAQVGEQDAGFFIDHGDGQLMVMVCPSDDVSVFADSRNGAGRDPAHVSSMTSRGWWGMCMPGWWDAHFDRTQSGATAAARLIVAELQCRQVRSPGDLRLTRASLGTWSGTLDLPGSGIPVSPPL